jgi:hypothetical protein
LAALSFSSLSHHHNLRHFVGLITRLSKNFYIERPIEPPLLRMQIVLSSRRSLARLARL